MTSRKHLIPLSQNLQFWSGFELFLTTERAERSGLHGGFAWLFLLFTSFVRVRRAPA